MKHFTPQHILSSIKSVISVTVLTYFFVFTGFASSNIYQDFFSSFRHSNILNPFNNTGKLTGPVIGVNQTICYNTSPATLTIITKESGGIGTIFYQWQQSLDNGSTWKNTYTPDSISYSYRSGALTATTQFILLAIDSDSPPNVAPSNIIEIKVSPKLTLTKAKVTSNYHGFQISHYGASD